MTVTFELLGEVRAHAAGEPVDLGPARQRCVLACLLVDPSRSISTDQLVDRVWGVRVPRRARETLHSYLSRLRRILATAGDIGPHRRPDGYLLAVEPDAVDLHRFRSLVAAAREADGDRAVDLFDQALRLWRGEAFGTLDTAWLAQVRAGLDAERHEAELDFIDASLCAGNHAKVLTRLATLAAAHPLDERIAAQLLLALYRSGRPAAALAQFQQVRLLLAEELGVDPGAALRALHQAILTDDPALIVEPGPAAPERTTARPRATVPAQLPLDPHGFTGRVHHLTGLDRLLSQPADHGPSTVVVAVAGAGGVGKTALAVHWAHRVKDRFPDGQLYVDLHGFDASGEAADPGEVTAGFLRALGLEAQRLPAGPAEQAALYRSMLAGRRVLVVLDNARDADQVRPLLPADPGCLVVVTSRDRLTSLVAVEGARPIMLDVLTADESRQLLANRLGTDRIAAEPAPVDAIAGACAGLPLALTIVAARAATHPHLPLAALADELRDAGARLDALLGGDTATDLRSVFSWSYRRLSDPAAGLFRLLGLHPGPDWSDTAAASLAAVPVDRVRPVLAELARANLISQHRPGRYTLHDLLGAYAAELTVEHDAAAVRSDARRRLLDHYVHTAEAAAHLLHPQRTPADLPPIAAGATPEPLADPDSALAWFSTEQPVLHAVIRHTADRECHPHAWQLVRAFVAFLDSRALRHESITVLDIALDAARRRCDDTVQAFVHERLASAYAWLDRYDDARTHYCLAEELYDRLADPVGQGRNSLYLAGMLERRGDHHAALEHAERALELLTSTTNLTWQALARNTVGWYRALVGDHAGALADCQEALRLNREIGYRHGEAATSDSLGYIHHQLGKHADAVVSFHLAADIFRDIGSRYYEAGTLVRLGDTYLAMADRHSARSTWRQALHILTDLGHADADTVRAKLHDL